MIEEAWLKSGDPDRMLGFLRGKASDRKLRLFSVACCRSIWDFVTDPDARRAVEVAESYADGTASVLDVEDVAAVIGAKIAYFVDAAGFVAAAASATLWSDPMTGALQAARLVRGDIHEGFLGYGDAWQDFANLLRDIFGNPFCPETADPRWLTPTTVSLSQAIYDERAFDRLPILGDALEEAGCTNQKILSHCRNEGEHVRGCWVVDLLLGKE
ncbi:hypothetical protein AYO40_05280 [Planctomycetaceae bacterium SCGC AG-212-D15]|nr:hypothetical protein AYO40_05280 [Planctomycetaceae bacterium SCGC AG-212-D15]